VQFHRVLPGNNPNSFGRIPPVPAISWQRVKAYAPRRIDGKPDAQAGKYDYGRAKARQTAWYLSIFSKEGF
jgi:hypothetical protein